MTKSSTVKTTCPYCGVGCGIVVNTCSEEGVTVSGDKDHPANLGRLCSKGAALSDTLSMDDRLLFPEVNGKQVDWDYALNMVAERFRHAIAEHGTDSVAFYVSGQLLTEDYYVANKLMKGFIGTANIDTNSRLCMSSAVAGYKRAFGSDTVPCDYTDLEQAELIVIIGSNTAWCHPVLYQRIKAAKIENPNQRIVVIDPRVTATSEIADLHLSIKPGTDVTLFNGLLNHMQREGVLDWYFLEQSTTGFAATLDAAKKSASTIAEVAKVCDVSELKIAEFFRLFTHTKRVVSFFSQGVNQSSQGTDKVNAIINCHLATGRIGKPGMGPFSITGQPNAMGGREVGGLANQLAAHMDIENPEHRDTVQTFWSSPVIAKKSGLKSVDMFNAIERGEIKAIWIMATNPVDSLPDADRVRAALKKCETVIVSDCIRNTDTTAQANILLPALTWGEKEGTVTNSERRISRQRAFLSAPAEAKADWWIITEVAKRMGFSHAFSYDSVADIFREHAALSGYHNNGQRDFDISLLANINDDEYESLHPVQWPIQTDGSQQRLFSKGEFFHPDKKARLIPVMPVAMDERLDKYYPLVLNTGRVRDHWHTMTRTGKSARLSTHSSEPCVEIHPHDAIKYKLNEDALARVKSKWGSVVVRVKLSSNQRRGDLFIPMHWNDQYASNSRVDTVVNPLTDPHSGQPDSKYTPVTIEPVFMQWESFYLSRDTIANPATEHWVRYKGENHWCYEMAAHVTPDNWNDWAKTLMPNDNVSWLEYSDAAIGRYRAAIIKDNKLHACLFIATDRSQLPARNWLQSLFSDTALDKIERACLLAGKPASGVEDAGPIICSCYAVGKNRIIQTIMEGATTVEQVGEKLKAGTNCGSCLPEIKTLVNEEKNKVNVA